MLALIAAALAGWMALRGFLIHDARREAREIIARAYEKQAPQDDEAAVTAIAAEIFQTFRHQDPATIALYRLRPFVTNRRLPDFLRLPEGVMEMGLRRGYCDNAGRLLAFVLAQEGFESVQWDMVQPEAAHAARLVNFTGGRSALVDPFYGFVTVDKEGRLASPQDAQARFRAGEAFETIFRPLGAGAAQEFYEDFDVTIMAAQGKELVIASAVPQPLPVTLGNLDGRDEDVKGAALNEGLTPHWNYAGHRYNRGWVRVLQAHAPVQIEMVLMAEPDEKILRSMHPRPEISERRLRWKLKAGEKLTFRDGEAGLSLRRLNSFIGVDQIRFENPD